MTEDAYPRERVKEVLTKARLPVSYRIIPRRYLETPLGTVPGDSRFCTRADGFTVLYISPELATALIETVVRDRFTRRRRRDVLLKEVTERVWAQITTKPRTKLHLLDLRKDGCVRLGAPTDAVNARNHAAGRALGRTIYRAYQEVDGLLFSSRLTGADGYAVFDRAIPKLLITDSGTLQDHPKLPDILGRHHISLVVRQ